MISDKLNVLIKVNKLTNAKISRVLNLDRSSIYRYFNGATDIKSSSFVKLLEMIGIDLESELSLKIEEGLNGKPNNRELGKAFERLIMSMEYLDQKSILDGIIKRASLLDDRISKESIKKIKDYLGDLAKRRQK